MWLAVRFPVLCSLLAIHVNDTDPLKRYRIWSRNRSGSFVSRQEVITQRKGVSIDPGSIVAVLPDQVRVIVRIGHRQLSEAKQC
jgi:hypothetical protein